MKGLLQSVTTPLLSMGSSLKDVGLKWTWLESGRENHASMISVLLSECLKKHYRYFTDLLANLIYAYDFDDGKLSNRRVAVDAIARGLPEKTFCDGLCIDKEGYIWSARFVGRLILEHIHRTTLGRWGGSRIVRFSPQGNIDAEIQFPTALNVTACCFGGGQSTSDLGES